MEKSIENQEISPEIINQLVIQGDMRSLRPDQKVEYYHRFCKSLGLNTLTQPFQLITFQGKEKLYATKDCTEQLRKIHGISIIELKSQELKDVFIVTAKAMDKNQKSDVATGVVCIMNLKGEALANALMKAETKAKRRVTLSICGLGILDESELDTMPPHEVKPVTQEAPPIEAMRMIKEAESLQKLTKIFNAHPSLHTNKEFVKYLSQRKREILTVNPS